MAISTIKGILAQKGSSLIHVRPGEVVTVRCSGKAAIASIMPGAINDIIVTASASGANSQCYPGL